VALVVALGVHHLIDIVASVEQDARELYPMPINSRVLAANFRQETTNSLARTSAMFLLLEGCIFCISQPSIARYATITAATFVPAL
jgi:hypothetical protein